MKGHFINAQVFAEGSEQSDQRLADGAGADDVDNAFIIFHLRCHALLKRSMTVTFLLGSSGVLVANRVNAMPVCGEVTLGDYTAEALSTLRKDFWD